MQNVISKIDGATGKVTVNPETIFTAKDQTKLICPGSNGGKNWPAGAYSPTTNVMYMPLQNMCMNANDDDRHSAIRSWSTASTCRASSRRARPRSARCGRSRPRPARRCGSTSSAPACCRSSPPAAVSCSAATANGRFKALDDRDRQGAVGGQPRRAGQRLPGDLRGGRQAVRRGDDRPVARRRTRRAA